MEINSSSAISNKQIEQLTASYPELKGTLDSIAAAMNALVQQNRNLQEQVEYLTKLLYAPKSEKSKDIPGQECMFNEAEKEADIEVKDSGNGREQTVTFKAHRKPKAAHEETFAGLPVEDREVDLPDTERHCPHCGEELTYIGREFVRDEVEVITPKLIHTKVYRKVYGCPSCKEKNDGTDNKVYIRKAETPALIPNSYVTPSLCSLVIYNKYRMSLPLYRQEQLFTELGISLNRATMSNWVIYCGAVYIAPVVGRMMRELMSRDIVHCDETPVQVLHEDGKTAESKSYMWVACSGNDNLPRIVIYQYHPSRKQECAIELLEGFKGTYIVCDGYQGYNHVPDVKRCGCYAHLRRMFVYAITNKDQESNPDTPAVIGRSFCDKLFYLESQFADLSPEGRTKKREEMERPVIDAFWKWVDGQNPSEGSRLGKAVNYARNQRPYLENYLLDGRIAISNNVAENSIRPFTVGRKNWLFSDTVDGASASAAIYSLVETAKVNNLRVKPYLEEVLTFMRGYVNGSGNIDDILPWAASMQERFGLHKK
jgi:transposase